MWRFESVHSFASVGNLYQKMHFAGSNLSTDPKCPKCIYKISKNFRVEKSGEISRNLRFSRFFVPASKSDTHHGWDGRIWTSSLCSVASCSKKAEKGCFACNLHRFLHRPSHSAEKPPRRVAFLLWRVSDLDAKPCVADLDAGRFCRGYTTPLAMMGVKSIRDLPDF